MTVVIIEDAITKEPLARTESGVIPRVGELVVFLPAKSSVVSTARVDQVIYDLGSFGFQATLLVQVVG